MSDARGSPEIGTCDSVPTTQPDQAPVASPPAALLVESDAVSPVVVEASLDGTAPGPSSLVKLDGTVAEETAVATAVAATTARASASSDGATASFSIQAAA